ncbi:RNA-guided endonuclease InsQ/TnpB family protein [Thermus scotoductus]|uniref:RNA-guided endonuclease InsQ/TnpB family protein n=1 Tax=Thermus scotoductus TaxID=37636 RepID=UPI0020A2767E|nr:helix-turn-helix domain-containing protein [Thermus scotoductus]
MRKAFKYRLYPTKPQVKDLERTLELCRELYNAALQERRDAYKKAGKSVGLYQQKRYLPQIREELPQYKRVHSQVLQDVLHRVDKAFQGFFRRLKAKKGKAGYPASRGRGATTPLPSPRPTKPGSSSRRAGSVYSSRCFPDGKAATGLAPSRLSSTALWKGRSRRRRLSGKASIGTSSSSPRWTPSLCLQARRPSA